MIRPELKKGLQANVTDVELLEYLMQRLDPILRDDPQNWDDQAKWNRYVSEAKEPSPDELARYLVGIACAEGDDTAQIARKLSKRVFTCTVICRGDVRRYYVKPLAEALLKANCKGERILTEETRARLESLVSNIQ